MIIGLTGSIASGKSTVASMLKDYGVPIVDADVVARQVVEPGTSTLAAIVECFGPQSLLEDGHMNRAYIGQIIFHHPERRQQLNQIIHPAIRQEMIRQRDILLAEGYAHVVMDIPLLFEGMEDGKPKHEVDRILVVSVSEDIQLTRLMERNQLSKEEALARIRSQLPLSIKEQGADAVVYNNGSIDETRTQLASILRKWQIIK